LEEINMAYATINPATGEQLATFPEHTAVEVEAALATAQKAFGNWRHLSYVQRAAIVNRAAGIMRERSDEFSKLITLEMGKVYLEAVGETQLSADILSYYAENAEAFLAPEPLSQRTGKRSSTSVRSATPDGNTISAKTPITS
jgi:succinate-semialdehyde dehydrogenase / glutarate-semialdehyde dehydrogenase